MKFNKTLENKCIQMWVKLYIYFSVLWYPIWGMFRHEYTKGEICIEPTILLILLGCVVNIGFCLLHTTFAYRYKKTTILLLILGLPIHSLMLLDIQNNPFLYLNFDQWDNVKLVLICLALIMTILMSIILGAHKK
ncbi:MAG: hypothetical protein JNM93_09240 [Bacteriovoracaceae bacterium]|nr:hypothetical protein [Bacteriovoracaceae bacterium]